MLRPLLPALLAGLLLGSAGAAVPVAPAAADPPAARPSPHASSTPSNPVAAASAQASRSGHRVAVPSLQSETADVVANPDGSFTSTLRVDPVRVRRGTGWVPVDPSLHPTADGGLAPAAATVPVVFSGGGDQPLVRLGSGDTALSVRWPGSLPTPRVDGDTATYPGVLSGVDLRMRATARGFTQVLVVKDRAAAANPALSALHFDLDTAPGLAVRADRRGNIAAYDRSGRELFGVGAPMMWDSAGRRVLGRQRVEGDRLTLEPDRTLLLGKDTTFPLYIDPDFAPAQSGFAMVLSGHPDQAYWGGDGDGVAKVGDCDWPGCNGIGVARSYFRFDASALRGTHVLSAEFNAFESHSPSCSARPVEAWGTNQVSSTTAWNGQPFPGGNPVLLGAPNVAHGFSSACPGAWVGFTATAAVSAALTFNGGITTILLKAADEGDPFGWKKFATNPTLAITYNRIPNPPATLKAENKTCGVVPNEARVAPYIDDDPAKGLRGPRLSAQLSDNDGGLVHGEFEWWNRPRGTRLGTSVTPAKSSGLTFTADVPPAFAADGTELSFRVRASDGIDSGPWSAWCDVTVDRTGPQTAPTVTSVTYPECANANTCPTGGGIGRTGGFTFGPGTETDVGGYLYDLHDNPSTFVAAKTDRTAAVLVTPPDDDPQTLFVRTVDRAGNVGEKYTYHFKVGVGTPPRGRWRLDGQNETTVVDDSPARHDATVTAVGSSPQRWQAGHDHDALWFDGVSGHVNTTGGQTVRTDISFSVSAWVKLDDTAGMYTVVSQDGNRMAGFYLQNRAGKWDFQIPSADADAPASFANAMSTSPARVGVWTHLVGVYDVAAKKAYLYVNGVLEGTASHATPWNATGTVQIGRAKYQGNYVDCTRGAVDEVAIYDRVLSTQEIHDLATMPTNEELFVPLDETAGTSAADVSGNYRMGTLGGAGSWTEGKVGTGAVRLSGSTGTLDLGTPAIRTDRSFTVSAWVLLDQASTTTQTILSQDGTRTSGFELQYRGDVHRWGVGLPQADTDNPTVVRVTSATDASEGEWTHLAAVYDSADRQLRLYVNGALDGSVGGVSASWNAAGNFQVGRGRHQGVADTPFTGAVDDVHAWTGVRTDATVDPLGGGQIRQDYLHPVTSRTTVHTGQLGRFVNTNAGHIVTTGPVPPEFHLEDSLGLPAPAGAPNTQVIYSCRNGQTDYFLDLAPNCNGHTVLGTIGSLYVTPPTDVPTLPVYRCLVPGKSHFAAHDSKCEGQTTEFLLGYARAYRYLVRNNSTGFPYDHATSTRRVPANYRPEGNFGVLATVAQPDTIALMSCIDDGDTFLSTDPACEGATVLFRVGFVWTTPPQGVTRSRELFRCLASWNEVFESTSTTCEGQQVVRSLGYVVTSL